MDLAYYTTISYAKQLKALTYRSITFEPKTLITKILSIHHA